MSTVSENESQRCTYRSIHAYTEALRQWLQCQQSQHFLAMQCLPPPMYPIYHTPPSQPQAFLYPHVPEFHIAPPAPQALPRDITPPAARPTPVGEYTTPPVWKRAVAELLDFAILLVIKISISILIFNNFGLLQEEAMDFDLLYHIVKAKDSELDYEKLLSMTSATLALQLVHRFCVTVIESLWLARSFRRGVGGCTPGKILLGIRVIGCDDVIGAGENRVRVVNPRNLGFINAFMRSLMKNFGISFFFPVVLTIFMFDHHRAIYDMGAGSIVVEEQAHRRQ